MTYQKSSIEPLLSLIQAESGITHPLLEPFANIKPRFEALNMQLLNDSLAAAKEDMNAFLRFFAAKSEFLTHPGDWLRTRTLAEVRKIASLPACVYIPKNFEEQAVAFERAGHRLSPDSPAMPKALLPFMVDYWGGALRCAMELPFRTRAFFNFTPETLDWLLHLSAAEIWAFSAMHGWTFDMSVRPDLVDIFLKSSPLPELEALLCHECAQRQLALPKEINELHTQSQGEI